MAFGILTAEPHDGLLVTPDRLKDCLETVRWAPETLASALDCELGLVHAWIGGEAEVPAAVKDWIEALATVHRAVEIRKPSLGTQ